MNNTNFTDAQIAAFTVAAEAMKANDMDYWPHALLGLEGTDYLLACMEDGAIYVVHTNETCSFKDFVKVHKILGA